MADAPRRLRIAHVVTRLINGGADENTVLSCNHAVDAGHRVVLLYGAQSDPEILARVDHRVEVVTVPGLVRQLAPIADARACYALVRRLAAFKPDVVHTHTSKAGILGRLAARIIGAPAIIHGVHIAPFANVSAVERLSYIAAERAVQGITDAYVHVSRGMRELFLSASIGAPHRHHVVRSGFDVVTFRSARPPVAWREILRLAPGDPRPPVVLMLAALEARKRHLEFLEVAPLIVERLPSVRIVLAGDGALRPVVEARIQERGLQDNVVLTGFYGKPEELIALADVCVLASMREGLPRVVMQYLAGGKPVVAADLPGLDEVLRHGVNGLVVPNSDLTALARDVVTVLEERERWASLSAGAQNTDLQDWSAAAMGDRIERIYERVLDAKHAGAVAEGAS